VGNIAEKVVYRSVFWTIWHCNLSAEFTKTHSFRLFLAILPTEMIVFFYIYFSIFLYLILVLKARDTLKTTKGNLEVYNVWGFLLHFSFIRNT